MFRLFLPKPRPSNAELAITFIGASAQIGMVFLAETMMKKNNELDKTKEALEAKEPETARPKPSR